MVSMNSKRLINYLVRDLAIMPRPMRLRRDFISYAAFITLIN